MSKSDLKKIVKKYGNTLNNKGIVYSKLFLYGSYAKGTPHKYSDIDIAVVLPPRKRSTFDLQQKLKRLTPEVDPRIEPILLEDKELKVGSRSIMGYEVKKYGILIK